MRGRMHAGRNALFAGTLVAAAAGLLVGTSRPGWGDDRDLLRINPSEVATPYLFLLLDSSGSMNFPMGPDPDPTRNTNPTLPVVGYGDDPDSRLWGAKWALFSVLEKVDDVHLGFATFNQDELRVRSTHWAYYVETLPGAWPAAFGWPTPDPDGLTTDIIDQDTDSDGTPDAGDGHPDNDIEGDAIVFGQTFVDSSGLPIAAGTCNAPLDLSRPFGRLRANNFAKLGADGSETTTMLVTNGTSKFRLAFTRVSGELGADDLVVTFALTPLTANCTDNGAPFVADFTLKLDPGLNRFVMVDEGVPGSSTGNDPTENTPAIWPWNDADDAATCTSPHPFSGEGWEGNYDSEVEPPESPPDLKPGRDKFCTDGDGDGTESCVELRALDETVLSAQYGRPMDYGDVIPFNWLDKNKDRILQRLAPNWPEETPDFGVAGLLSATPHPDTGTFEPRIPGRRPILARGDSPIAKSLNDVRCWYLGGEAKGGKCSASAYEIFGGGYKKVACENNRERFPCDLENIVLISDGEDVCKGQDATAALSDMKAHVGVRLWAVNVGDPKNCSSGGGLHSMVQATGGECINVSSKEELRQTLLDILDIIREVTRAFGSAAVPSVQAVSEPKVFLTNFIPLNDKSVWDGHVNGFLKPVPLKADGTPDTSLVCGGTTTSGCFLWDAGKVLRDTQYDPSDFLGNGAGQRRVAYSVLPESAAGLDAVPVTPRLFDPIDCSDCPTDLTTPACRTCRDLLAAFEIPEPSDPTDPDAWSQAETKANAVVTQTLSKKPHTLTDLNGNAIGTIDVLLGDFFHGNPVFTGPPISVFHFAQNSGSDGTDCKEDDSGNPGYRCFFRRHQFRRQVLFAPSDDGMLHAFNGGQFDDSTGTMDNGTGNELFAFMPRGVMRTVRTLAEGTEHHYTVDGTPAVSDVFIDPLHAGAPDPDERRWRTVLIAGLREGGSSYYTLDVTQPDKLVKDGERFEPVSGGDYVPSCIKGFDAGECGAVPYGTPLWELFDDTGDSIVTALAPDPPLLMDEDGNLVQDLGDTWSVPNIGRIRICREGGTACRPDPIDPAEDDDLIDLHVAVFGGGMDPENKFYDPRLPGLADDPGSIQIRGHWLYIVDIETGKVIYKRELCSPHAATNSVGEPACVPAGAAPSPPAAVDTDQNGYLDRVYIGTIGGFMFRVDLGPDSTGDLPQLEPTLATALDDPVSPTANVAVAVERIPRVDVNGEPVWEPEAIFDANWEDDGLGNLTPTIDPRPLYHRPSVIFAARLGQFALAFGSGDREDLWSRATEAQEHPPQAGRFYLFIDDTHLLDQSAQPLPLREGNFRQIQVADPNLDADLLVERGPGQKGWYLVLQERDRLISESFSFAGITTFPVFNPQVATLDKDGNPVDPPASCSGTFGNIAFCSLGGTSRFFVVGSVNGNGFLSDADANMSRFETIEAFVSGPFTEPGQTAAQTGDGATPQPTADDLSEADINVMNSLKDLFPDACKFANYRIDIKTITIDTRLELIAPVPVCIIQKNWKEF